MVWFKSIEDILHRLKQKGSALSPQVDTIATPKHNNGAIFVQTIADYPLVEAIQQNVVKHPTVPDPPSQARLIERQSAKFTEKYTDYIDLGVLEWRKAYAEHEKLGKKALLFVMTDDTRNCYDVAAYLEGNFSDLQGAVLIIHTKKNGEISESTTGNNKEELDLLRKQANEIDSPESLFKAIISVMVLKEGWDVRNVTTIVGLRAYSAASNILPEQTLGRGLRKMYAGEVTHTTILDNAGIADYRSVIAYFSQTIMKDLKLVSGYNVLYGKVKEFVQYFLFNYEVDLENPNTLRNLSELVATKTLIETFKTAINALTIQEKGDAEIREYYPDFLVKLTNSQIVIVETKGLEDLDVPHKMNRLRQWCEDINKIQSDVIYDFVYVDQENYEKYRPTSFHDLLSTFKEYTVNN